MNQRYLIVFWKSICVLLTATEERFVVHTASHIKEELPTGSDLEEVRVVQDQNATLPCRISIPINDAPVLTLWYISSKDTPVYSYDERPGQPSSHWYDPEVLGSRAFYQAHWTPPSLELSHTRIRDGRLYRCRVDFSHSNSRVAWVRLDVIVPPHKLEIVQLLPNIQLGENRDVTCKATGGTPSPRVLWFQGGTLVDSTFNSTKKGEVYNTLEVPATRHDLTEPFVCQAINNDLRRPKDIHYLRNVTCEPLNVTIATETEPIIEGRVAELSCISVGSNPSPYVSWYQEGHKVKLLHTKINEKDNVTTSTLLFNATREDHGKRLICRAVNKYLLIDPIEAVYTLNVAFKPSVNLTLGRALDASNLKEGNDVFFECLINSNPPPYKVEWFHNDQPILHNVSYGILLSKFSLALQKVTLNSSGKYECKASNVEGDTKSKPININIKYAPRCSVTPSLRGVALREPVNVTCTVDSDPQKVKFFWTFNNSARKEQSEVVPKERFVTNGPQSTLFYTPLTERDYGTLLCYAENSVGHQKEPCSFTVISAGPPEKVTQCSFKNITSHSTSVICSSGFNGGLPQRFLLQVWTSDGEQVVNFSSSTPEFWVRSLAPGHSYTIAVTSFNTRGAAEPVKLELSTLKEAEMHKSLPSRTAPSPLMLVLGVIGGALFVVLCLLLAMFTIKGRRRHDNDQDFPVDLQKSPESQVKMKKKTEIRLTGHPDILQPGKAVLKTFDVDDKEFTKSSNIRSAKQYQVSNSPCDFDEDMRRSSEVNEFTKLTSSGEMRSPSSHGIGRGVSLGPGGLELGLVKGFGSGGSLNLGVVGYKDYPSDSSERKRGCTRRAVFEGLEMEGTPSLQKPLLEGGESIL